MPQSLAARVRAKHPGAYDDLDDAALERAVLAKHPEYADLAQEKPASQAIVGPQQPPARKSAAERMRELEPYGREEETQRVVADWAKRNPGTAGAAFGGAVVGPMVAGASVPLTMLAEGAAAGIGTMGGNAVAGKPQDMGETAINAAIGGFAPGVGPGAKGVLRLAKSAVSNPIVREGATTAATEAAASLVGIPPGAVSAARYGLKALRGRARPAAGSAVRPVDDIISEDAPGWRPPIDPRDPPVRPHGERPAAAPAYTGPERRMTPKEGVEAGLRDPDMVRKAGELRKAHANIRKPAETPRPVPSHGPDTSNPNAAAELAALLGTPSDDELLKWLERNAAEAAKKPRRR